MSDTQQNSNLKFTRIGSNPGIKDLLDFFAQELMLTLNCHAIATVQTFTPSSSGSPPRISATINYKKTTYTRNADETYSTTLLDFPVVLDCPAIILGGGGATVTFPISEGDQCLLLFNDRDIDNWYQGQFGQGVNTARVHSFSDAIALIGLYNKANAPSSYDMDRAVMKYGSAAVGVREDSSKVLISGTYPSNGTTLNTLLQQLITDLKSLCTACSAITVTCAAPGNPSSVPLNVATFTNLVTTLASDATAIAGLLE